MNALVLKDVSLLKSAILYIAVFGIIFCAVFNEGATMCVSRYPPGSPGRR